MALPVVKTPTYDLVIPSTGQKVKYRPFLVKEEKILMVAAESEDRKDIMNAMKDIVKNCVEEDIDVDSLATFDLEYIFISLRSKSVGETVDLTVKCEHCGEENKTRIDFGDVEVTKQGKASNKVEITDSMGIVMKYPNIDGISKIENADPIGVIKGCIDYIYDEKQVYKASEASAAELDDFVNSLGYKEMEKIKAFFDSMPKVTKKVKFKCSSCKKQNTMTIEGFDNFFV
jgi:ribosomal protein L44E